MTTTTAEDTISTIRSADEEPDLDGIHHELVMWTCRLEAVRSAVYEAIDGGRTGDDDDPEKLHGVFELLGDIRDGQWELVNKIDGLRADRRAS